MNSTGIPGLTSPENVERGEATPNAKATPKIYRVACDEASRNFGAGDSGAGKYFLDSLDDRHISDSRTVHGG